MANKNLNDAGAAKRDEFYTQLAEPVYLVYEPRPQKAA